MFSGADMQLRLFDEVHRCRTERHDYMTILKALRFVYRDALNGSLILVTRWCPAVNRDLGNDAVMKVLLQRVDSKPVHITGIDNLLKQQVDIQLIIMLFPGVATKVLPRFESTVHFADGLQDRLCS